MKLKTLLLVIVLFIANSALFSQNHYKYYQDGLVVFQIKVEQPRIPSKDRIVDFNSHELFTIFLKDYEIIEVLQLHPDLKNDELLNRTYQIRLQDITKVDEVAKLMSTHPMIEYAELKALHYSNAVPNDQYYSNQWSLPKVQAAQAWDLGMGNSSVIVAVTDDAMQTNHPDLQNAYIAGRDMHNNNNNPSPCGSNDGVHGTHVSGIVGAETNNGTGVAAIGGGVSIMPVKIGDCSNQGLPYGYEGVVWAANNGAHIINMSWGSASGGNYGQNVINNAWNQGCILVAAAGNDGVQSQLYPAAYNNVIAVANTTSNDTRASSSQYGTWIDISAPGSNILSTIPTSTYANLSGTSMASPMVAGLIGLMKSYAPSADRTTLINCLYNSADPMPNDSYYNSGRMGAGRINAYEALLCLSGYNSSYDAGITEVIEPVGGVCAGSIQPKVKLQNFGSTTLTSATIQYNFGGSNSSYNWTGNLATGQSATVNLPTQTLSDGNYTFTATVSNPNGQTDENPANNTATSTFSMNANGETVTLTLNTDCWGSETTWEIKDGNNAVLFSGGPYGDGVSGTQNVYEMCLGSGCYTFHIYDDYGDGMSGSQYQGCNINGDYNLKDGDGNILFSMGSNPNFGASASHEFCLNSDVEDDAGIAAIVSPVGVICETNITPVVELKNYGTNSLTSVVITYNTGGAWQNYNWSGNLAAGQTVLVNLPTIAVGSGQQNIVVKTELPNGNPDSNTGNDEKQNSLIVLTSAASLPFVEDFEGGAAGWLISNLDDATTWTLATNVGGNTPGSTSAVMDFYNYSAAGERDGLISPKIDLTGVGTAEMTFDHAYRRYNQSTNDSLIVYVSIDCGNSFQRVDGWAEDGTGSFATQTTSTASFVPSAAADWCFAPINQQTAGASCITVNLDAYVGHEIMVMFETYKGSGNGNNLFIDNINITGEVTGDMPEPNFNVNTNTICEGETVDFTDASSHNPTGWNWTFPGGSPATSTAQNPSVTYSTSGTYDVTLEVTNNYGTETQTFTQEITVNALPNLSVNASNNSICVGESVDLTASGAATYAWDNGLGIGATQTVSPTTTTTYEVTGNNGDCSSTETITITVNPAPSVSITASSTSICIGESVDLTASGANNYAWDNGLGTGATQTVSPTTTTTYEVTGNNGDCSSTETITITVSPAPSVSIAASSTSICIGESVDLTASGANNYAWDNGLGTGATQTVSPTTTTTYEVTGNNGSCLDTESITITVVEAPNVTLTASATTLCSGEETVLTASGASDYTWDNGLGTGASQTVSPTTTTSYTVTGSNGDCVATATVEVVVQTGPTLNITASDNAICKGESVMLTANGGNDYVWSPGSSLNQNTGSTVIANPSSTTTYSVMSYNDCGTSTETVEITVHPLPSAPVIAQNGNTLSVVLTAGETAEWYFNGNYFDAGESIEMIQSGEYTVIVTNEYGCNNTSSGQFVITTGLAEMSIDQQVQLYPNPTADWVTVAWNGNGACLALRVIDAQGRLVIDHSQLNNNTITVDLSKVQAGVYMFELVTTEGSIVKRVTKK